MAKNTAPILALLAVYFIAMKPKAAAPASSSSTTPPASGADAASVIEAISGTAQSWADWAASQTA